MERLLGSAWWVHGSGTVDGWDLANRFIVGTLCQYQKGHVRLLHIPWWWFPNWYYVNQKLLGDGKVSRGHHSCYLVGGRTVDPTSSTPWWQTFAGNNSAWFVVRFGLRHVRRDDLRSSWFLAVNCFLVKRYIGIGMKHYPNVWIKKTYALISHTKENNFNQYTKTNLWPYTWNQNKIQNNLFLYSSIWHYFTPFGENGTKKLPPPKTPSNWAYLHEPSSRKKPEVFKVSWWVRFQFYHTKDFLQWKKPQFKPKMFGFQTILGLNVVEWWKSFCEVSFFNEQVKLDKRWYNRTGKWVVMGFVSA